MNNNTLELSKIRSLQFYSRLFEYGLIREAYDIVCAGGKFRISRRDTSKWTAVDSACICNLLHAFSQPRAEPDKYVDDVQTNSYPEFRVRLELECGDVLIAHSRSRKLSMSPWGICWLSTGDDFETDNTLLGPAIAAILPIGAVNRRALEGHAYTEAEILAEYMANAESRPVQPSDTAQAEMKPTRRVAATSCDEPLFHIPWEKEPLETVGTLISEGANINAYNHEQETVLEIACRYGKFFFVEPLLSMGAEPTRKCLYYACSWARSFDGITAVRQLIHAGADATDLLIKADSLDSRVRASLREIVLSADIDIDHRDKHGRTGLMRDSSQSVNEWLRAGADLEARDADDCTPLLLAVSCQEKVAVLIEAGADVNAVDHQGKSALIHAVERIPVGGLSDWMLVQLNVIQTLISAGAEVSLRDHSGLTATEYARKKERAILMGVQVDAELRQTSCRLRYAGDYASIDNGQLNNIRKVCMLLERSKNCDDQA